MILLLLLLIVLGYAVARRRRSARHGLAWLVLGVVAIALVVGALGQLRSGDGFVVPLGLLVLILLVAGYVRYRHHRHRLHKWLEEPKVSLKRRVEEQ